MAADHIFATQADLEQLIGSGSVTILVLQKRLQAVTEENEKLQKEIEELRAKAAKKVS